KSNGAEISDVQAVPLAEAAPQLGDELVQKIHDDLDLLATAGTSYSHEAFLRGDQSPVFFGSAMTNFGVEPLLDYLAEHAAKPAARTAEGGEVIAPSSPRMTGFIFKIQANMNPRHRDRIAFFRVASGKFTRNMDVTIGRSGETLRLSKPHSFLAQE